MKDSIHKIIFKDKDASKFIKKLFDMNQIIKNIYKDEPNFSPIYTLTNTEAIYSDENCIPEILRYKFSAKISNYFFKVTVNSGDFFSVFKEASTKNSIDEVEIEENYINFKSKDSLVYTLKDSLAINKKIEDICTNYDSNIDDTIDESYSIDLNPDIIKYIIDNNKDLISLILDAENSECYINGTIDLESLESYLEFFVNKKFINGISYKVKHLKSGDKVEYTPIDLIIKFGKGENYYDITLNVNLKNSDTVEHHFMVCDF